MLFPLFVSLGYLFIIGNRKPEKIPQGKCFVMGDNTNKSWDSRYWGMLDLKDITGRVECCIRPEIKLIH
jgi:signal peptidase I